MYISRLGTPHNVKIEHAENLGVLFYASALSFCSSNHF